MLTADKNIIFLFSLPRSGSTLLQRILGRHPAIRTESETWMMLHPLYALKEDGHTANYNEKWAFNALKHFLSTLPEGEESYFEGLRLMFSHIYGLTLENSNEVYFLDKTPRYYEIIPELNKVFPNARFIALLRNPLAVINSRIKLLNKKTPGGLHLYSRDLFEGPRKILDGIELLGNQCKVITYEDLVEDPAVTVKRLCNFLSITYDPDLLDYNVDQSKWNYGDPENIYKNSRPISSYKDSWKNNLSNPQLWKTFHEYFNILGPALLDEMGYNSADIIETLTEYKPNKLRLFMKSSLCSVIR